MNTLNKKMLLSAVVLGTFLAGCAGAPKKNESLEEARSSYLKASSNQNVVRHASEELDNAKVALHQAQKAWKNDASTWQVNHHAYVASKRVAIAELIAQRMADDQQLAGMDTQRQTVQLAIRTQELEQKATELSELQGMMTERGLLVTLGDVLFDVGQSSLKPSASFNIDKIADYMRQYPDRTAIVEGHTDAMGSDETNLELSRERALSVRNALVQRGIASSRISTQGYGEASPVADNNSPGGRQANRRVEVIFPEAAHVMSNLGQ